MALPSKQDLKDVIVEVLTRARDEDRLGDLTVRIVLREIATHYGLEEDVFHSKSYKPFIKDTVFATMNSFNSDPSDEEAHPQERKAGKEKKEDGSAKVGKRKHPSTGKAQSSDMERAEESNKAEHESPPRKKASARAQPSKQAKPGKTSKKPESDTKHKSKAIIESSDEEAALESSARKPVSSPRKEKTSAKSSPPKQKPPKKVTKDDSDVEVDQPVRSPKKEKTSTKSSSPKQKQKKVNKDDSDVEMDAGPSSSGSKPKPATESPKHSVSRVKELSGDPMESELSSVIDEPPTKRQRKKQDKEPVKPQKDEKTKRGKKKEPLSKDEETVNKLKSIVVACGVRKVWKKEFEGLDRPSQQIKRLHSILGDLGMTPRYSMEKAKAIRDERELAQELKEVQDFDKAMKRREKGLRSSSETAESVEQDDSDGDAPVRKKQNARSSIMAFLQDQGEEE